MAMQGGILPASRYQAPGRTSCSVTTRPLSHRPRLALDRHDPVDQHQRLVGQADARRMASIAANSGPSTAPIEPTANSRHCARSRKTESVAASKARERAGLRHPETGGVEQVELGFQALADQCRESLGDAEECFVGTARGLLGCQKLAP